MSEPKGKRLVVCCDGTWNFADQRSPTNVTKVALAVGPTDAQGMEQRVFYHHGVGTHRWDRIRGGAFGMGLSRGVRDAYRFLVQNYDPGDELFFFGFSRGAFTARSTVGLVRNAGILRRENIGLIDKAYALYRSRKDTHRPRGRESILFRRAYSNEPRIRFVGVWDTVGAYGIPVGPSRFIHLVNKRWEFHDTDLSRIVHAAYQALAIDEKRAPFRASLWTVQADPSEPQEVEQVWFSGVHSDVGGGYDDHGLSDIALLWMVDRAARNGLAFREGAFVHEPRPEKEPDPENAVRIDTRVMPDPHGQLHNSRSGFYRLMKPCERSPKISETTRENVSPTVVQRHLGDSTYAPANLIDYIDDVQSRLCGSDRASPYPNSNGSGITESTASATNNAAR